MNKIITFEDFEKLVMMFPTGHPVISLVWNHLYAHWDDDSSWFSDDSRIQNEEFEKIKNHFDLGGIVS